MKKIGVLIVTYNQYKVTVNFISKFLALFKKKYIHLLILDNNSQDGTYEKLHLRFPDLDIRKLNDNYGCITGRNIGVVELINIGCNYILILDNDVEIEDPEFFNKMLQFMENNNKIDGCSPIVRWGDNRTIQALGARLDEIGMPKNITDISNDNRVDILPGCAQFMRISAYKNFGLYDNDLSPISIEDYEWGIRASRKGAKLCYNSQTEVFHYHSKKDHGTHEKISNVINGRVVFLRKYPSIYRMLKEVKHCVIITIRFGLFFTLRSYLNGCRKRIWKNNYDFEVFASKGLSQYYRTER